MTLIIVKQIFPKELNKPEEVTLEDATRELIKAGVLESVVRWIAGRAMHEGSTNIVLSDRSFTFWWKTDRPSMMQEFVG